MLFFCSAQNKKWTAVRGPLAVPTTSTPSSACKITRLLGILLTNLCFFSVLRIWSFSFFEPLSLRIADIFTYRILFFERPFPYYSRTFSPSSALLLCVHTRYNLFTHSSCTSLFILIFIKSTVDCIAHFISLHILLLILFIFSYFLSYSYLYLYIFSCVMFHFLFYFFALSIERTCPDLHATTDYTLYDCVCDE